MKTSKNRLLASLGVVVLAAGGASLLWQPGDQIESVDRCSVRPDQLQDVHKRQLGSAAPVEDSGVRYGHTLALDDLYEIGKNQYEAHCRICHGVGGKGDGPAGRVLDLNPRDLTQMAKNNGGEFPWDAVLQIIDGRSDVEGHLREGRPVWGERWTDEEFTREEPVSPEDVADARIRCVAHYLSTIQED